MKPFRRFVFRFVVIWFIEAISLVLMSWIVPGISLTGTSQAPLMGVALAVALILGALNTLVRPILLLLTLPLNVRTIGLTTLPLNAVILRLAAWVLPQFNVANWGSAMLGALALSAVNTLIVTHTTIDDDYSFFEGVAEWLSQRQRITGRPAHERGIVMLEIDGLSHGRFLRAIELGYMPAVKQMLEQGSCTISPVDCGLPSQTSACQAGIMFGNNDDIPAFRWYDKPASRMIVSNNFHDAAEINNHFAQGQGLLRGGSSIFNLLSGDAAKTILTVSALSNGSQQAELIRRDDIYLFLLNPYIFSRSLMLTLWDLVLEFYQALRQKIRNVQPRVNRLHKGYPIFRAISNVFLREMATFMAVIDVIRGLPAIYVTFVGYDEVAHYAGPDTRDALATLRGMDTAIRRINEIIRRKGGRPYDLFVLSDHGQSAGATFQQRYDSTLSEFIARLAREGTRVVHVEEGSAAEGYTAALVAELRLSRGEMMGGRLRQALVNRTIRAFENRPAGEPAASVSKSDLPGVIVCVSGNLANVYFTLSVDRVPLSTLNLAYPGMVDALVMHPGIGFVVAYEDGHPFILGKNGARDLRTGTITGSDPLEGYGDVDTRTAQLLHLADFPHAGDLIINGNLFADGSVASFEDMVGCHGGLGGAQTEAFLLHPLDMQVPCITSATQLFPLLNARRDVPVILEKTVPRKPVVSSWSMNTIFEGVKDWRIWLGYTARSLRFDRSVYRAIAQDAYTTGPALVLVMLVEFLLLIVRSMPTALVGWGAQWLTQCLLWLVGTFLTYGAARILGGRGDWTWLMRVLAFTHLFLLVGVLSFIPEVGNIFPLLGLLLQLLASWIAIQEVMHLSGWRILLIPILDGIILILTASAVAVMINGLTLTVNALVHQLGIILH